MVNLVCPLCAGPPFSSLAKLLRHVRVTHSDASSFSIQCTLQDCCRTFKSFKSYRRHIYTYHNTMSLDEPSALGSEEDNGREDYHGSLGDPNEDAFDQPTQEADSKRGE